MIYFDNAATTWPKPPEVLEAIARSFTDYGANPGRGAYKMAMDTSRLIYKTRETIASFFGISDCRNIVFTRNTTESVNLAIKGILRPGDHVLYSSLEHNAVWRPINALRKKGVSCDSFKVSATGKIDLDDLKTKIRANTKLIVCIHGSNVLGCILDIAAIGAIAKEHNICFLVDAAQTAGALPIYPEKMGIDLLAFPGHKGLYGPMGIGGLYVREGLPLATLQEGGTGSNSLEPEQPEMMPDRLESGTVNTPGIAGLGAGIEFLNAIGLEEILCHEQMLTKYLYEKLSQIPNVILYGPEGDEKRLPVVSFNIVGKDSNEVGWALGQDYDISVRAGYHCAPLAHKTMGTLEQGAVRISFGIYNQPWEVEKCVAAIQKLAK
ncbi:MAG: aminotransferase class V-fold PLP-dependent enzyme [Peptococcaceae bacterium]|jgi:cysteine desulfurase/selenocysteine lyase|nr:aminotransferase class V-fold PLP-dependent enzyme [Peptococcaceae bacterium]